MFKKMALNLHFREITWNLQMIKSIVLDQTLAVNDSKLFIENRLWSAFWRGPFERSNVLDAIQHTWNQIDELLVSYNNCALLKDAKSEQDKTIVTDIYQNLHELTEFKSGVESGLTTLCNFKRYQTDSRFAVKANALICDFQKLCTRARSMYSQSL